jgi:hypothetical protein
MIVRQAQIDAFKEPMEARYVDSAVSHMMRYDPVLASTAGRKQLEKAARQGLQSARSHGLSGKGALQLYLELMMSLGSGFDTGAGYEWLRPFLQPRQDMGAVERARFLHFHACAYLSRTRGRNRECLRAALNRALEFLNRLCGAGALVEAQTEQVLSYVYPGRRGFLTAEAMAGLLPAARAKAAKAGLPAPQGTNLLLLVSFLFGCEVDQDPLYPWVSENLSGDATGAVRQANMAAAAGDYISGVLRSLNREVE